MYFLENGKLENGKRAAFTKASPTVALSSLLAKLLRTLPLRFLFSSAVSAPPAIRAASPLSIRARTFDFSGSFFEGGEDEEGYGDGPSAVSVASVDLEEEEEAQCPPGLRQYETMAVLRPEMTENERFALIQRYDELHVAGGGMYVEVFNRGVIPLAYSIRKKNKAGEINTYFDGIHLLFTYFIKPESIGVLESRFQTDDDVIRSTSFKVQKKELSVLATGLSPQRWHGG